MCESQEKITIDQQYLREAREHIHRHPELGFDVGNTANFIADKLNALKLEVKRNIGRTGLIQQISLPKSIAQIA